MTTLKRVGFASGPMQQYHRNRNAITEVNDEFCTLFDDQ
jgi:hypothetical protein